MKLIIIFLLSFNVFAVNKKDIFKNSRIDGFWGVTNNEINEEEKLDVALVEKGACLKYMKNGESYWTIYETDTLKVVSVGDKSLKVKRYAFLSESKKWRLSESFTLPFENQIEYVQIECPKKELRLTDEEFKKLKER